MGVYTTFSPQQTAALGAALGAFLRAGDAVLLRGGLGAGKSVLARGIARALGVEGPMASPTFTLMQPYEGRSLPLFHFDLYRLEDEDEFYAAGLDEFVGASGVALIEWPMEGIDYGAPITIDMARGGNDAERRIQIRLSPGDGRAEAVKSALSGWEAER